MFFVDLKGKIFWLRVVEDVRTHVRYTGVILSGGHTYSAYYDHALFMNEIELIRETKKPSLGICFGFELIAHTFGGTLKRLDKKDKAILNIERTIEDPIFGDEKNVRVFESHRWVVEHLSEELIELARFKDGIEVIKHKTKPIYGVQFHPEILIDKKPNSVFTNWLRLISNT